LTLLVVSNEHLELLRLSNYPTPKGWVNYKNYNLCTIAILEDFMKT